MKAMVVMLRSMVIKSIFGYKKFSSQIFIHIIAFSVWCALDLSTTTIHSICPNIFPAFFPLNYNSASAATNPKNGPSEREQVFITRLRRLLAQILLLEADVAQEVQAKRGFSELSADGSQIGPQIYQDGFFFGREITLGLMLNENLNALGDLEKYHDWFQEELYKVATADNGRLISFLEETNGFKHLSDQPNDSIFHKRLALSQGGGQSGVQAGVQGVSLGIFQRSVIARLYLEHLKESEKIRYELFPHQLRFAFGFGLSLFFSYSFFSQINPGQTMMLNMSSWFLIASLIYSGKKGFLLRRMNNSRLNFLHKAELLRLRSMRHESAFIQGVVDGYLATLVKLKDALFDVPERFLLTGECADGDFMTVPFSLCDASSIRVYFASIFEILKNEPQFDSCELLLLNPRY